MKPLINKCVYSPYNSNFWILCRVGCEFMIAPHISVYSSMVGSYSLPLDIACSAVGTVTGLVTGSIPRESTSLANRTCSTYDTDDHCKRMVRFGFLFCFPFSNLVVSYTLSLDVACPAVSAVTGPYSGSAPRKILPSQTAPLLSDSTSFTTQVMANAGNE